MAQESSAGSLLNHGQSEATDAERSDTAHIISKCLAKVVEKKTPALSSFQTGTEATGHTWL